MNINDKETQLLYTQMYASILFIITNTISIILTYNNIKKHENKKRLFTSDTEHEITIINRVIITILVIIFTYINYKFYEISKFKNNSNLQKKEFFASILALIAGFILLYTTIKSVNNDTNDINPNTPIL